MNFFYSFFSENLLLLHGDIETKPGPNKKYKFFTCCHWNVNSFTAHNMLKLSQYQLIILFLNMILFVLVKHT